MNYDRSWFRIALPSRTLDSRVISSRVRLGDMERSSWQIQSHKLSFVNQDVKPRRQPDSHLKAEHEGFNHSINILIPTSSCKREYGTGVTTGSDTTAGSHTSTEYGAFSHSITILYLPPVTNESTKEQRQPLNLLAQEQLQGHKPQQGHTPQQAEHEGFNHSINILIPTSSCKREYGTGVTTGSDTTAGSHTSTGTGVTTGSDTTAGSHTSTGTGVTTGSDTTAGSHTSTGTGVTTGSDTTAGSHTSTGTGVTTGSDTTAGSHTSTGTGVTTGSDTTAGSHTSTGAGVTTGSDTTAGSHTSTETTSPTGQPSEGTKAATESSEPAKTGKAPMGMIIYSLTTAETNMAITDPTKPPIPSRESTSTETEFPASRLTTTLPQSTGLKEEPGTAAEEPGRAAGEPGTAAGEPGRAAEEPGTAAGEPGTAAGEPGTAAGEPGTAAEEPGRAAGEPGTAAGEPGTAAVEPSIATEKPGIANEDSASTEKLMRPSLGPTLRGKMMYSHRRDRDHKYFRPVIKPANKFPYYSETTSAMRKLQFAAASEEKAETEPSSAATSDQQAKGELRPPSAESASAPNLEIGGSHPSSAGAARPSSAGSTSAADLEIDAARPSSADSTSAADLEIGELRPPSAGSASAPELDIDSSQISSAALEIHTIPSRELSCSGRYMHAHISKHNLQALGYNEWDVHLNDHFCRCKPRQSYVCCKIPLDHCGTRKQQTSSGTTEYSNVIKTSISGFSKKVIFIFRVTCKVNENKLPGRHLIDKNYSTIKQFGKYRMNISLYESFYFKKPIYNHYFIRENQDVFFQASLHNPDPKLVLFMDTCVISPDINDFETLTYDLIRNGCVQDSTYKELPLPRKNVIRWKFNTSKYFTKHNAFYLRCYLPVCTVSDHSSRCYKGCLPRKIRTARVLHDYVGFVMGPFQLWKENKKHERKKRTINTAVEVISPVTVTAISLGVMVFVLAGFLLGRKLVRKNDDQMH
ncbi:uncharacterized protein LOC143842725 [Paroedura picta]|uniref:uncharacterized protein LOC143842725 n=1 Tax=Paroedura picta TaxID=143630 RepID=UPI004055FDFB